MEWTPKKGQCTKLILEKKILLLLLSGFKLSTYRSRVQCSYQNNQQCIPAPLTGLLCWPWSIDNDCLFSAMKQVVNPCVGWVSDTVVMEFMDKKGVIDLIKALVKSITVTSLWGLFQCWMSARQWILEAGFDRLVVSWICVVGHREYRLLPNDSSWGSLWSVPWSCMQYVIHTRDTGP